MQLKTSMLNRFANSAGDGTILANKIPTGSSNTTERMKQLILTVLAAGTLVSAQDYYNSSTPMSVAGNMFGC
jgi:hypothetical protein